MAVKNLTPSLQQEVEKVEIEAKASVESFKRKKDRPESLLIIYP